MSLPGDTMAETETPANLLYPDRIERSSLLEDFEKGGVAINDPSEGLLVQTWKAWSDGANVFVAPHPSLTPVTNVLTGALVSEVALAFDQNMRPVIAYLDAGMLKLYWHDTSVGHAVTTDFAGCASGMLCMDDKRDFATDIGSNDVLFFYIRDGGVYYRQQRERYGAERLVYADLENGFRISRVGMAVNNKVQLELRDGP